MTLTHGLFFSAGKIQYEADCWFGTETTRFRSNIRFAILENLCYELLVVARSVKVNVGFQKKECLFRFAFAFSLADFLEVLNISLILRLANYDESVCFALWNWRSRQE